MPPKGVAAADKNIDVWIVLFCGLPGSGKSTLRNRVVQNGWAYVNQDEMGTAEACEKALVKILKAGKSCIIDRCNVTSSERRLCMQHANRALEKGLVKGVTLHFEAVWMATPPDLCKKRAAARERHETLSADKASDVIDQFCKGLRIPERSGQEPYEATLFVADEADADLVVQRYANPAKVDANTRPSRGAVACVASSSSQNHVVQADYDGSLPAEMFVLRHGERADRAKGRDEGCPDDAPLTKEGRETAKRAGMALRSLATSEFVAVYSSPFFRCLQTANEIAAELGLPVRVEPGLAELCSAKIFEQAPDLRSPTESIDRALIRAEVDLSEPPIAPTLPEWPEHARDANTRVVNTAKALADRHPGRAICLVCHSHSLVEITRHVPKEGGGAASSTATYCAMSHISPSSVLLRCLDMSYLKDSSSQSVAHMPEISGPDLAVGYWGEGWHWSNEVERDPVDTLLALSLEEVLEKYDRFRQLFERGDEEQKEKWRQGWISPDAAMRTKLEAAHKRGFFEDA